MSLVTYAAPIAPLFLSEPSVAATIPLREALVAVAVTAAAMVKMEMLAAAETAVGDRFDL